MVYLFFLFLYWETPKTETTAQQQENFIRPCCCALFKGTWIAGNSHSGNDNYQPRHTGLDPPSNLFWIALTLPSPPPPVGYAD